MTPYKGIIKIICTRKTGCLRNLKVSDVQPGCIDCPEAINQILDLDDKVIYEGASRKRDSRSGPSGLKDRPAALRSGAKASKGRRQ